MQLEGRLRRNAAFAADGRALRPHARQCYRPAVQLDRAVQIVDYRREHHEAFVRINREWLEKYGLLEAADESDLANPDDHYMRAGGAIFVAQRDGHVVGVCAIRPWESRCFEISKLGVAESARGRGIGRRLAQHAIDACRNRGASEVVLISNSQLASALRLYESLGFRYGTVPAAIAEHYTTADVFMSLDLTATRSNFAQKS